jgi:hypothetical protein
MNSTVGYLTMAFLPRNLPHAICNTADQIYPSELKQLYLLYQRGRNGTFPTHIEHDFPFQIIQSDVEGHWPQLWILKVEAYLKLSKTDFTIIWDEDDRFPPLYTLRIIQALESNPRKVVAWTYKSRHAKKPSVKYYRADCPIGCTVFRTDFLRKMIRRIIKEYPSRFSDGRKRHHKRQEPQPTPNNPKRMSWGALDNQMCKRIVERYPGAVLIADPTDAKFDVSIADYEPRHFSMTTGYRTYIQHPEQNSVKKDTTEDIV